MFKKLSDIFWYFKDNPEQEVFTFPLEQKNEFI